MATVMTNEAKPRAEAGHARARAFLEHFAPTLMRLAGVQGQQDGASLMSHHTPSPTRGERSISSATLRGQREFDDALDLDAQDRTREIASIDNISQRVDQGETVHPPMMLRKDPDLGLRARFPGEMLALAVVGGIEAKLLADPIQTTLNLSSWTESFIISSVVIVLVVALSHLFADAWIRAQNTTIPAMRDSLRRVATGFAAVVVLAGVMVVVARAFSQRLVAGSAGSEAEAWAVFVIFQLVFVTANLALAVRERDARLHRWLAALRDRRTSLDAAGSEETLTLLRREFWAIVYQALCNYRNELQAANESGLFKVGWDNRTSEDLSRRQLLRQVFPSAPVDPTPDFDDQDDTAEAADVHQDAVQDRGERVGPTPPTAPGPAPMDPPAPEDAEPPLNRVRRAVTDDPPADLQGDDHEADDEPEGEETAGDLTREPSVDAHDTDLDDLISQVLGEAGEDAA